MSEQSNDRSERDSMGEVRVPADALYGAQTQRAVDNFPVSGLTLPRAFIRALGLIKGCAATANARVGELDADIAEAIAAAAGEVEAGAHDAQFPVDVFQTGSGTSSNMNANEVIAALATRHCKHSVHPNDHVNRGQSSNDVIPTAIHVSSYLELEEQLLPALAHLARTIAARKDEHEDVVKTGRTHLMDAMPMTVGQELGAWEAQVYQAVERIRAVQPRLAQLAQGATAVGTGINAHPRFAETFSRLLAERSGQPFTPAANAFAALAAQDTAVELSGALRTAAVAVMKIANDLRWMNSGPLTGLAEINLPELQPGSSIMPGKVNPVIPESAAMVCAQVLGNDATIAVAGQSGNFQLNVMLPVIAYNLLQSIQLLTSSARLLADKAVAGFSVNRGRMQEQLERNPILVTALTAAIGYEQAAEIAKRAYAEGRPIRELAAEMTDLGDEALTRLLDPATLTHPRSS